MACRSTGRSPTRSATWRPPGCCDLMRNWRPAETDPQATRPARQPDRQASQRRRTMNAPIIQVQGLTRRYGDNHALDGIDFSASAGKVYGLVGANGAGKTTLLKHLLGLLRPQAGTVRVFGEDPVRHPARVLKRIGYLSEQRDMPEWMRIGEFLRSLQAFHPTWDMRFACELLDSFNLDAARKISALSQGMRAQTGIIAALAHRPELLILDEPSNGLDAAVRLDIIDAVIRTVADEGRCVLFS